MTEVGNVPGLDDYVLAYVNELAARKGWSFLKALNFVAFRGMSRLESIAKFQKSLKEPGPARNANGGVK